jgi:hypothetical protein
MLSIDQALLSIGLASLSSIFSYFLINRNNRLLKEAVTNGLKVNSQAISSWINENSSKIQRAHSIIGSQGGDVRKLKQGEKLLSQSLIQNSPVIDAVMSSGLLSPGMQTWIDDNPDLVMQLLPKFQAVLGQMTQDSQNSSINRPHPFARFTDE